MSDNAERDRLDAAYADVFALGAPSGRAVVIDLAEQFFAATSTFDPDPHVAAFRAGQRAVWLYIAGRAGLPLVAR